MFMRKHKILIIIDQMNIGGAARVTSTLLHGLVKKGYEVAIALDNKNVKNFYPIPECIQQVSLPIKSTSLPVFKQFKNVMAAYKIINKEQPDVIIAVTFIPYFYAYYASLFTKIPIIAYDHTSFSRKMGWLANWIRFNLYKKANKLVVLTKKDASLLKNRFQNTVVIYNPLTYPVVRHILPRKRTILCAGRIDAWEVKGFDRIIHIWSKLAPKYPEWRLLIAGSGSDKKMAELKEMTKTSKVDGQMDFLGQVKDMQLLYSQTSIFALPSRIEGFPMVLLEAMSQGCVCCTFEMGGAVQEMMSPSSGLIIKDNDELEFEKALTELIEQYPNYNEFQESGYIDAGRFTCEEFILKWDTILKSVI